MNPESLSSADDRAPATLATMGKRLTISILCLVAALGGMLVSHPATASAAPGCADVDVVFARGTVEPMPPVGMTGNSFVAALRSQLPGRSVAAYGVNYPAGNTFNDRLRLAQGVAEGVTDAQNHIKAVAAACPSTRIVLGGYSQGAVVAGYATSGKITIPDQYRRYESMVPPPLPAEVANHVAAVVLFAQPSDRWIREAGAPAVHVGAAYAARTVRYCIPGDTICDGAPLGEPNALHVLYAVNGMTLDAARYTVGRL